MTTAECSLFEAIETALDPKDRDTVEV